MLNRITFRFHFCIFLLLGTEKDLQLFSTIWLMEPEYSMIVDWLIGMLLVSRSGLVEEDAVEVVHYYGFYLSSSSLNYFRENNVVVFPFPFQIFMLLTNLWFIRLEGWRTGSCPDIYPLIDPPGGLLAPGRGEILYSYPGIPLVPSYVSRLWSCPLSPARMYKYWFSFRWEWNLKAFLIPLWYS